MNQKDAATIIRQRIKPRLFDFSYLATRAHLKAFLTFKKLLKARGESVKILDVGCGYKPFKTLFKDVDIVEYVGVDFDTTRSAADVVASVDNLPFPDHTFDAILATEVLEHTLHLEKGVRELRRVSKKGALLYISTPFVFGEHGTPYDFQRITRYKYFDLFKEDELTLLRGTNSNLATPFFVLNVCLETISILKKIPLLLPLIYFFNNVGALLLEAGLHVLRRSFEISFPKRRDWIQKLFSAYFYTMPGGYDVIVTIKK